MISQIGLKNSKSRRSPNRSKQSELPYLFHDQYHHFVSRVANMQASAHLQSSRHTTRPQIFALGAALLFFVLMFGIQTAYTQPPPTPTADNKAVPATAASAAPVASPEKNAPAIPWKKVPDTEKKVLAPIEKDWSGMSGQQQRKLLAAAKEYPKLGAVEQDRFQHRLKTWTNLTPEQRESARKKYNTLRSLPPEKQQELKARWNEKSASTKPAPASAPTQNK
jgi:Protein of unknown function (DUF3106)